MESDPSLIDTAVINVDAEMFHSMEDASTESFRYVCSLRAGIRFRTERFRSSARPKTFIRSCSTYVMCTEIRIYVCTVHNYTHESGICVWEAHARIFCCNAPDGQVTF